MKLSNYQIKLIEFQIRIHLICILTFNMCGYYMLRLSYGLYNFIPSYNSKS